MRIGHCPPLVVGLALADPAGDLGAASAGSLMARRCRPLDWVGAVAIAAALVLVRLPERGLRTGRSSPVEPAWTDPSPSSSSRRSLALAVGENAVFDGWTADGGRLAPRRSSAIDPAQARLAMPKSQAGHDRSLHPGGRSRRSRRGSRPSGSTALKIREKIRALVWRRLEIMGPAREAVRRAPGDPRHAAERAAGAARSAGARPT